MGELNLMIYIDVSHVMEWFEVGRSVTGIQRVTFELAQGLRRLLGDANVRLLKCNYKLMVPLIAPATLLDQVLAASEDLAQVRELMNSGPNCWQGAQFANGSTVLLSEGLGGTKLHGMLSPIKKEFGLKFIQVIYDAIPLARPNYFKPYVVKAFAQAIPMALTLADEVVAISDYSRRDLYRLCASMYDTKKPLHVWTLPHEFKVPAQQSAGLPEAIKSPFVLIVGTIEDRKNQHLVADAWSKLAAKHGARMPQLVLAGKFGMRTAAQCRMKFKLALQKLRHKRIIALEKCNDSMLRALYDHCLFTIYVSSYEGWGLPVGESLWCGKPVLSGVATSLPEVGGDLVDYVDPDDQTALIAAIEKLCFDEQHREQRTKDLSKAKLRSWDDATKEFARLVSV